MLEIVLDTNVIIVIMGMLTIVGIVSKVIVNVTLNRMVRAAGNMNKSPHPLMRLVRAKFEHACMISDTVENVSVFVDKYLYEHCVWGIRLHSLRRLEKAAAGSCLLLGLAGAGLHYAVNGMGDMVLRTGAAGAGLAILIYLFHLTTDEKYRLDIVRNYMVDYLENVCRHKYEKIYQKEIKLMAQEIPAEDPGVIPPQENRYQEPAEEQEIPEVEVKKADERPLESAVEKEEPGKNGVSEPCEATETVSPLKALRAEEKAKERPEKDVLIRQILEEFMA